jgi:hypothetical protein
MNLKTWSLVVVALVGLQMTIAYGITRANKDIFDKHPANAYAQAIAELAGKKPLSGAVVRICYALCLVELAALAIAKYA